MNKHVIWAVAIVLSVAAISFNVAQSSIEDSKQFGFMMKACIDAGGIWKPEDWRGRYICARPHQ